MKTIAIVIARLGSTRLPGKVLADLHGQPVLSWVVRAPQDTPSVDETWVATSSLPQDDAIHEWCKIRSIPCFRGSETDVLSRVYGCAKEAGADIVIRLTGDCCFLDPFIIEQVIHLRKMTGADYANNIWPPTWPDGTDCEAITFAALEAAHKEAVRSSDRDCVSTYIMRNRTRFKSETLINPLPQQHNERFVLDTENDLQLCREIAARLPLGWTGSYLDIIRVLDEEPELRKINSHHPRNERHWEQIATEELPEPTFEKSNALLTRARKVIPLGAQTFSKSYLQYPKDQAPLFVTHGQGGYIYDADGQGYVDLVCGLLPIILGHNDPDINEAIRRQLTNGISFSTSTELEAELAEMLCKLIPCAEMVRFGKNGTDVTTAAVRAARAFTGRDLILLSGYHGWGDWSIWTTERNIGVTKQCSDSFAFGDRFGNLTHYKPDRIAAIIVEPNDNPEYLQWLRNCCDTHGIVLIFDEIITGWRYPGFSAQKHFGVTPDLACFGKALGNGVPINAVVGRRDIMRLFAPPDNVFFSGTFQGETLSLAAAIACIKKLERENVPASLAAMGSHLKGALKPNELLPLTGFPTHQKVAFKDDKVKTVFIREMIKRGVLTIGTLNLCYAHGAPELKRVIRAWGEVTDLLESNSIDELLGDTPVIGQVSVRSYS